jgi:upstream activation factor subunit UAF30
MIKQNKDTDDENKIFDEFNEIINNLNTFKTQTIMLQQSIKQLEKSVRTQLKCLKKLAVKNKMKNNRIPSGFAKPCKITKELCEFMNKEYGTEIARTEVTKSLIQYIKQNNLINSTNKKVIIPDEKLKNLLNIEDDEELTYFTIQKYMNQHFIKQTSL